MTRARFSTLLRRAIAVLGWCAVLLQFWLSMRVSLANGQSAWLAALAYFSYFTILSNLFVAVLCSQRREPPASILGCATTSIVMVGIIYHLLLRQLWNPQGAQWVADAILHYVVPIGMLLYWVLREPTRRLAWWAPLAWSAYPTLYLLHALIRGEWLGVYPYPFIDVAVHGYPRVALNSLGIFVVFITLGFAMLALSGRTATAPA